MHLRSYTPTDKTACLAIFDSNTPPFFAPHERAEFEVFLEREAGRCPYLVLEDETGQVLACGGYYITRNRDAGLCWGMVHRDHHRRGLGRQLLLARLQHLSQEHPGITVRLDTSQYTCGFFEKAGFVITSITENGYAPGLHRYEMELHLDTAHCQTLS